MAKKKLKKHTRALTKEKFKKAIKNSSGVVINIAENLGVCRGAVYNFINKYPDMKELLLKQRDDIGKIAVDNIANAIIFEKDVKVSQWYVERKLKEEYSTRMEQVHSGDTAMNVHIELVERSVDEIRTEIDRKNKDNDNSKAEGDPAST